MMLMMMMIGLYLIGDSLISRARVRVENKVTLVATIKHIGQSW